jgi:hypothetical protein
MNPDDLARTQALTSALYLVCDAARHTLQAHPHDSQRWAAQAGPARRLLSAIHSVRQAPCGLLTYV